MISMESTKQELMDEIRRLKKRIAELDGSIKKSGSSERDEKKADYTGSETILVVDDTEEVRNFTATLLRENGYRVLQAPDGESALDVYKSHPGPIDLILSDVVMPDFGGLEMVRQLQPLRQETRVLFMSGYNTEQVVHDDVFRIIALGANFISKPISSKPLLRAIRSLLNKKKRF